MATVPQTPATREPLPTLVAQIYGDKPTPAPQRPANYHTADERWQDAVTQVGEQLRAKLRVDVLPERLHKALALVLAHAVTLHPDSSASVQSGKQTYRLAPECPCADASHRAELCKHSLAVELHRRALAVLDGMVAAPASHPTPVDVSINTPAPHAPAAAVPSAPVSTAWKVHEAPASAYFRFRVGPMELLYTLRGIDDAELQRRITATLPTLQEIIAACEARTAQRAAARDATQTPQAAAPASMSTDLQALIQQAVQQALAAQTSSHSTPPANGTAPSAPPASPADWCPLHQVAMEQRSNAKGTWYSHWLASEQRYCKGK